MKSKTNNPSGYKLAEQVRDYFAMDVAQCLDGVDLTLIEKDHQSLPSELDAIANALLALRRRAITTGWTARPVEITGCSRSANRPGST